MNNNLNQQQYTLKNAIKIYKTTYATGLDYFNDTYANLTTKELYETVSYGKYKYTDSNGRDIIKTCSHLRHIKTEVYPKVEVLLNSVQNKINAIASSNAHFDKLYALLMPMRKIKGVGPQMLFDTTLHLACGLKIPPGDMVYLHSGALKGFKKLFPNLKLDCEYGINISELPPELQALGAYHCEHFFCLYHKGRLNNSSPKNSCIKKIPIKTKNPHGVCPNRK